MFDEHVFCTSMDARGYWLYGKKFLESYVRHCEAPLWCFLVGDGNPEGYDGVSFRDLGADYDWRTFQQCYASDPAAQGFVSTDDGKRIEYRFQAVKFSHKVFAETTPTRPDCKWWIWLDADVIVKKALDEDFFAKTCPDEATVSYIGRKDWDHSECGFVAYNLQRGGGRVLSALRSVYRDGLVFGMMQWHDSFVFDVVRRHHEKLGAKFHNLAEGVPGNHVWPHTVLGEYMDHQKGPELKKTVYGGVA